MIYELTQWQALTLLATITVYVGSALAIGTVIFQLLVERQGSWPDRNLVLGCAFIAIFASAAQILIQSGRLMDDGMAGALDTEMWALVAGTPLGTSIAVRVAGLALLAIGVLHLRKLWPVAIFGTALTALSFPLVGHATDDASYLLTVLIAVHFLVMAFWLGGLLPLHRTARSQEPEQAGRLAHTFGKQAVMAVGILVITGGWVAYTLVGSLENLVTTNYGLTLLAKLALVTGLLGLAALNKFRLVPELMEGRATAASALRRSIRFEALAFFAIFIATAILTTVLSLPTSPEGM